MKKPSFQTLRGIVAWLQAGVILTIPFIRVRGESALRFDVPSLKLYFFGSVIWMREAYFFLLVFFLFFAGVMLFTVLYGRIWCGWLCPQAVLSDFARRIEKISSWFDSRKVLGRAVSRASLALLSALVAANLISYFVSPYQMLADLSMLSPGPWTVGSWAFIAVLIYLDLSFARQKFCGSACPLVRYARGKDADPGARLRVLGLAAVVALIAVQLAYQIYARVPLDFWVMREKEQSFQQAGKSGMMLNDYALIVENRSLEPELFRLSIGGIRDARLIIPHNPILIPPNTALRMKFSVLAERKNLTYRVTPLRFVLENVNSQEIRIEQEADFVYPMRTERGLEI